ncbi:MAG: three-Cys-motif partner protein TcmP [Anaerolineae bacterium]|nr:three-Cys-motif partner protein TcmP [Anaerolineae bacterium]
MNKQFLESDDDGLLIRDAGEWVENKLYFLSQYLHRFIVSMSEKQWRAINYIDLFSGPGKNRLPNGKILKGSPLIAISQEKTFDKYFFSDIDLENIETLKKRCATFLEYGKISFQVGDANIVVEEVAQTIEKENQVYIPNTWTSLNLAFLDPHGLELNWHTVERLAQLRTDMIIYYPQMGISREAPREINISPQTPIDNFFGDTHWRDIYCQHLSVGTSLHRPLLDYYKSKLKAFGYQVDDPLDEPVFKNSKDAPLYRLLFVCKSSLGNKFWKDVTRKMANGQMKLL